MSSNPLDIATDAPRIALPTEDISMNSASAPINMEHSQTLVVPSALLKDLTPQMTGQDLDKLFDVPAISSKDLPAPKIPRGMGSVDDDSISLVADTELDKLEVERLTHWKLIPSTQEPVEPLLDLDASMNLPPARDKHQIAVEVAVCPSSPRAPLAM